MKFSNPTTFMASRTCRRAFPGDVVGLYDSGNFKIGDALTEGESPISEDCSFLPSNSGLSTMPIL